MGKGWGKLLPRPRLDRIQSYSGLVAFRSDSCTDCINAFQRSLKLGPVEAGSARICGTGGGGGQETATGTGVAQAAVSIAKSSEIAPRPSKLSIGIFLSFPVCFFLRLGGFFSSFSDRLGLGHEAGVFRFDSL